MRSIPRLAAAAAAAAAALALASCGGGAPATTTTTSVPATTTTTSRASGAPPSTAAATPFFTQSGTGDKTTKTFSAKGSWTLTWTFSCAGLGHKENLTVLLRPQGGKPVKVATQKGLGGGGHRTYQAGTYSVSVTTPCGWTLAGAST